MSKENAKKFGELVGKNPEILKECEQHYEGQKDAYEIFSKLAKEKGFDCTASELKEAMEEKSKPSSGAISDDDLEAVSGGGTTEQAILTGLSVISAVANNIANSKDKDGNINFKDPSLYIGCGAAGIAAGATAWMNYGNKS